MSEIASYADLQSTSLQSAKGRTPAVLCDIKATGVASSVIPVDTDSQAIDNIQITWAQNGVAALASIENFSTVTLKSSVLFTAPETAYYRVSWYTEVTNVAGGELVRVGLAPVSAGNKISSLFFTSQLTVNNYSAAGTNNSGVHGSRTDIVLLTAGQKYCFAANTNTADNETIQAWGNYSFTASIELLQ